MPKEAEEIRKSRFHLAKLLATEAGKNWSELSLKERKYFGRQARKDIEHSKSEDRNVK